MVELRVWTRRLTPDSPAQETERKRTRVLTTDPEPSGPRVPHDRLKEVRNSGTVLITCASRDSICARTYSVLMGGVQKARCAGVPYAS